MHGQGVDELPEVADVVTTFASSQVGRRFPGLLLCAVAASGAFALRAGADTSALAPCVDLVPQPSYAPPDAAPKVQLWNATSPPALPALAACLGVSSPRSGTFLTVAGTFQSADGETALLSRFGAVSKLLLVRYWSTTDHTWRPLLTAAAALTREAGGQPRRDFTTAEIESGQDLYLAQTDSRSTNEVIYRMRLREGDSQQFLVEIENVTPVRWWALTLYKPGELRSLYLLERRAPGIWSYYSLSRIGGSRWLMTGHENSYINRGVALYRHFAGIPTDLEPPFAR
jgi:hypothetical protein